MHGDRWSEKHEQWHFMKKLGSHFSTRRLLIVAIRSTTRWHWRTYFYSMLKHTTYMPLTYIFHFITHWLLQLWIRSRQRLKLNGFLVVSGIPIYVWTLTGQFQCFQCLVLSSYRFFLPCHNVLSCFLFSSLRDKLSSREVDYIFPATELFSFALAGVHWSGK